ncbi:MAG: peptidoglycan DD-metalloendopeptidase family protein [Bernardetiaceae bacterium]|nr:peptidoglycan DD-metalloendopeptidase family protein [Bernardetiaceae bacterium]
MHTIGDDTTFLNFLPTYKNSSYRFSTASQAVNIDATPSLLRENNQNYREGVLEDIVIISEEIAIDCVWIKLTDYYALWDSERINPYNIDASNFNDTIALTLYDEKQNLNWAMPLDTGIINSHFGIRNYRWHHGTDLDLNSGDPVRATFDGVVRVAKYGRGYGYHVVIRHYNGLETLYGHLRKLYVKPGTYVRAGQQLGEGGSTGRSTGPHLHFEVRYEGNAIDPALLFDFEQQTIKEQVFSLTPQHFSHLSQARQSAYHSVRSGDSLWKISRRYGTSIQALCKLNGISSKTSLRVGMRLRVR